MFYKEFYACQIISITNSSTKNFLQVYYYEAPKTLQSGNSSTLEMTLEGNDIRFLFKQLIFQLTLCIMEL